MKILWVKPGKILPLDSGGKLRTYNILRHLSANHDVTYLSYYGGKSKDPAYERQIVSVLPGAIPVFTDIPEPTGFDRVLDYLRELPKSAPYAVSRFASGDVRRILEEWISQPKFDVAVCDFLASAPNFPRDLAMPCVLFQHNVESVLWRRRAQFESKFLDRMIAKIEYARMVRYEAQQVRRFHQIFAVSERDREVMSTMVERSRVSVLPTGVDLAKYCYDPQLRPAGPLVIFTGSMDWEPNIDGVEYFCRQAWPRVLTSVPGARFRIVGRDPRPRVKKLASPSIEVTGSVDSIIDHLRDAAVVVVPLRIGSGTRLKIYEAMAMGKAVVSTGIGAEGLDVHDGKDILLADRPKPFADAVVTLLRDEVERRRYELAAAATARQHDWSVIAERFANEMEQVCRSVSSQGDPLPVVAVA